MSKQTKTKRTRLQTVLSALLGFFFLSAAGADIIVAKAPVIRSSEITDEEFDVFVQAHGLSSLSDHMEASRPEKSLEARLRHHLAKAQDAWISGSVEMARLHFRETSQLALLADWRDQQREAIHFALLRLAQTAATPVEKEDWIEKAVVAFPDISPDGELFPPPLIGTYAKVKKRVLKNSIDYAPASHFPGFRYLLVNGKAYEIGKDLKIQIPEGKFRLTAYSDRHLPFTEVMSRSQMELIQVEPAPVANGNCDNPSSADSSLNLRSYSVLYAEGCLRTKKNGIWLARESGTTDHDDLRRFNGYVKNPLKPNGELNLPIPKDLEIRADSHRKTWLWIGATALAAGSVYLIHNE